MDVASLCKHVESDDFERLAIACGLLAPVVGLGAIVLATLVAPPETFTWRGRALSDLGRLGSTTFWLFNGGLITGGVLGIPFVWHLWEGSETRVERLGVALLAVAILGFAGVGVFFLDHTDVYLETPLHAPAALGFFLAAPLAQWVYGTGLVLAAHRPGRPEPAPGSARLGLASIWLGIVHPVAWLCWLGSRVGTADGGAWFAVPELVAAIAFGGWVLLVAGWLWRVRT